MTIQGGVVEQKTIGVKIGTNGTFVNTVLNGDSVELSKIENTDYYYTEGEWISEVVDIGDNFKSFGKVFVTNVNEGNSNIEVLTRTSDDGVLFDSWINISETDDIKSVKRRYISIKVIFQSGITLIDNYISEFNNPTDADKFNDSEYINTVDGLILNRDYSYSMELDVNWNNEGELYRKLITRNEWIRIDEIS